jgi:site-specific DNA-methyltransferase (adenine-specific)
MTLDSRETQSRGSLHRIVRGHSVATLYLGDCLDVLPDIETANALVTDPPFGIGFDYGEGHKDDPEQYEAMMKAVLSECQRIIGDGPCFVWQGMLQCNLWHRWFPPKFRILAACKGFVQYRPTPVQWSFDPIIFWGKPACEPSVYRKDWHLQSKAPFGAHRERIDHPCPRPLEQTEYVVSLASVEGQTVLDPFMGSGTTGAACLRTGRNFVGIEKDPKHFATAVARLEREANQGALL